MKNGKQLYEVVLPLEIQRDVKTLRVMQQLPRNKKSDYAVNIMRELVAEKVLHAILEDDERRSK